MKHPLRQFFSLGMKLSKQGPKPKYRRLLAAAQVLACTVFLSWASPAFAASPIIVDAPDSVATEDVDYTYAVDASDADGDPLTFSLLTAPSGMIINVDSGVIQWTPLQEHVGDTTVSVEVSDGVLMDTLTYTLTVLPTNDPPVVIVPDTTFAEDGVLVLDMKPLVDDVDDADNQIIWSVSGTSALTATITDTVITLEALEDFEGSEQITFTATDPGGLSHSDVATITVTPVNDPPVIFGTPDTTATEGVDYTFTVEASDDADGDVVSFALLTAPGGMVIDASTGVISWLPNQANVGDTTVSVRAFDPSGAADTLTYTLIVLSTNSAPSIAIGDQSFDEDDSLTIDMSVLVDDVDDTNGDLLIEVSGNSNIVVIVTGQSVKLKAQSNYSGVEQLTFTVRDTSGASASDVATVTVDPVNDLPVITNGPDTTATESVDYTLDLDGADVDGDVLTWSLPVAPIGMVINAATGEISWLPGQADVGSGAVTAKVVDPSGGADSLSWTLTVLPSNSPPVVSALADTSFDEDATLVLNMNAVVTDPDNPDTEITWSVSGNTEITVTIADSLITLGTTLDFNGSEQLTFTATDAGGLSHSATATLTVNPMNDKPDITSAPDTTATEGVDYTLDVDALDVDGDVLTWSLPVAPGGMVINTATGLIDWLPTQVNVGDTTVTVKVVDVGGAADSLSFTLTVLPSNGPPVVSALADTSFDEDATLVLNMNAVVTDPDNPDAEITWSVSGNTEITVTIADSLITLGTTLDFNGSEQLTFTATDAGGLSHSATATLTVNPMNDKPDITSAPDTTATEGVDYTLDVDALDVDGDVLTWSLPVAPGGMVINTATGLIDWLPTQVNVGDTTVTVKVVDVDGAADSLSFTLTVLPDDSTPPPVVSDIPDTTFDEDGTLVLNMNPFVEDLDHADNLIVWTVSGNSGVLVSIADSLITLTAQPNYNGTEQLTFTATDPGGLSDIDAVTVTVNSVNDLPRITNGPDTTATENVDYTLDLNADDADGDVLAWSLPVAPGGMVINALTGEISWLPTQANVGDTTVVAKVVDPSGGADSLSFTLTVLPVNSTPIVSAIADTSFDEDGALVLNMNVLVNDPDNADSEITWTVSGNANITVTIADSLVTLGTVADFNGVEQLTFTATDPGGLSDSESSTITVSPVNDVPIITNGPDTTATENVDYTFDLNADDADGDVLAWSLPVAPGGMTINSVTGEISWLPLQVNVGDTTVTAKVVDGSGAADSLTWTLTVLNANTAPTIAIGSQAFAEDDSLTINMNPLIDDVDNSDAELTVEVSGNSEIKVTISDSLVTLKAAPDYNGIEQLTFTVRDVGGLSASAVATVTVSPVDDAPVMVSVPDTVATEDVDYTFDIDATDADGDVLAYSLLISPSGMSINTGTGVIQWTPLQSHVGDTTVSVEVTDGALKDTLTYTLTVQNDSDAPIVAIPDTSFAEDTTLVLNLNDFVSDVDTPKDQLTWGLAGNTKVTAVISDSTVTLSAPADYNGAEQLQFIVVDPDGLSDIAQFTVTVTPVADVPRITSAPDTTATEDDDYTFDVEATDVDGDVLVFSLLVSPTGMVIDADTGVIQWQALQEHVDVGDNAVSVRVADPGGLADTLSFVVRVLTDNDVPVISGIPDTSFVEDGSLTLNLNNYVSDVDDDNADLEWSVAGNSLIVVTVIDSIASLSAPENYNGSEQISFHATDPKGASTSDILVVTVTPVNDVPVITSDPATEATEDAVYTYDVASTDVEDDARTFELTQNPDGMIVDPTTGLISWHVPLHLIGDFPVTVTVTETSTSPPLSDSQSFTVSVRNVNDPPSITFSDTSFVQNDTLTVSFTALNLHDRDPDDSFDALRRTFRINGLSVYSMDLTLGKSTGEHAIEVGAVDVQGNIYFAIDTTANVIRFWHRDKWFGEEKMSFETTDNSGFKVNDEVSIRVTPLPILSIFPVADTIKTNAAELTLEGIASQTDSLWITYLRDDGVLLELPLILIVNNQFSQLIPINNGVDPRTIRVNLRAKNAYANISTYLREVTFRPTVDDEEGGVILLNDDDGIPNNNTRVEVGDQSVPEDVDLVLAPDDSAAQAILGPDAGRLVNAYEIDAFDQNGEEIENFKFLRKVTLVLRYDDTGLTLDEELNLKAYFYDGAEFRLIGGRVDTTNNTVTVEIDHLTQFAVLQQQVGDDKGFVYAAPNPFTPINAGNQFDETQFIIPPADLGVSFTIEIYNARGQLVRRLENLTKWDGKDDQGRVMDSGVYIFQFVTDTKRTSGTVLLVR